LLSEIAFTCGLPAGNDNPTNTEANADSPSGTHDPYGGTTYTPLPSANAAGMGIAGFKRVRGKSRRREGVSMEGRWWMKEWWAVMWACLGPLLVGML
jgi:hypothetical protein